MTETITRELLRQFVPMDSLASESLDKLIPQSRIEQVQPGKTLFRRGDREDRSLYLLEGQVRLTDEDGSERTIAAGGKSARAALAPSNPRRETATTITEARLLVTDNNLLDILITWQQSTGYVVEEIAPRSDASADGDDGDWMTRLLASNIFMRVPPANIQQIFMRMEAETVTAGTDLIRQGDTGDCFYVITRGRAEVLFRRDEQSEPRRLAVTGVGDGIGEEALMSNAPRNATVRMLTDGEVMRLDQKDFDELLKAPLLEEVDRKAGEAMVANRRAIWVDVRTPAEYKQERLKGSINIPLNQLRSKARLLPSDKSLIVYCDTGRRSSAGAFILSDRGFDVYWLRQGHHGSQVDAAGGA